MSIDVKTVSLEPQRKTFDHLARRFGDKPASRYQEACYDIQPRENLHYIPTWDPSQKLYDETITKIVMEDWYAFKDPRQYYYNTYTQARSRQQETAEANFTFVESRGLADMLADDMKQLTLDMLVPLRHASWGSNMNNTFIASYGYGVTFTQPCMYAAMDQLGIAQYLSRLGLLLSGPEALAEGKQAWLEDEAWQPLRQYIEDCLVVRDPFELYVAQNYALDGLLYPLVYEKFVDEYLSSQGASSIAMLTQFIADWFVETSKWVNAVMKTAAEESEDNRKWLEEWSDKWTARADEALQPLAAKGFQGHGPDIMAEVIETLNNRSQKNKIKI